MAASSMQVVAVPAIGEVWPSGYEVRLGTWDDADAVALHPPQVRPIRANLARRCTRNAGAERFHAARSCLPSHSFDYSDSDKRDA